jgi:hypothetical protein
LSLAVATANVSSDIGVASVDGEWCLISKLSGSKFRALSYKVKLTECYKIPVAAAPHQNKANTSKEDNESDMDDQYTMENYPKQIVDPVHRIQ